MIKRLLYEESMRAVGTVKVVPLDMRARTLQSADLDNPGQTREAKLCVPTFKGFRILHVDNIVFCKAESSYTVIYLAAKKSIIVSRPLVEYEKLLSSVAFLRVHRAFLINPQHVVEYRRGNGGRVIMSNGAEVEISRRKREMFLEKIKGVFLG